MNLFAALTKYDAEKGLVYGYASTEALDSQGEVVKLDAVSDALGDYMKWANLREMHQPSAVGVVNEAKIDAKGLYIVGKVVDEEAKLKCREGVYKGFSIGGKSTVKKDGVISSLTLTEISLVDRPANPECKIEMYKMDRDGEIKHAAAKVEKGMYSISWLAGLLDSLNDLKSSTAWESQAEGDGSSIPEKLRAAVNSLSTILVEMTQEETAELTATDAVAMAAKTLDVVKTDDGTATDKKDIEKMKDIENATATETENDVEKAGKTISSANMKHVQSMHDATTALGASCAPVDGDTDKSAHAEDLRKADIVKIAALEAENAQLKDDVAKLDAAVRKALEQPLPIKGQLRAINKGDDVGDDEKMGDKISPVRGVAQEKVDLATEIKKIQATGGKHFGP